jgi:hypothetical protein
MFVGLTAYALFAGSDFGAGVWDLLAGGTRRGQQQRDQIEHSLAPVWEANHVWLIFVLVVLWTGFPPAFAAIASTLYIPLTLAALGMIARGSAFAFRKTVPSLSVQRFFGAAFAFSSFVTPFFPRRHRRRHRIRPGAARHRGRQRGDELDQSHVPRSAGCWPSVSAHTSPQCCCARTRNGMCRPSLPTASARGR